MNFTKDFNELDERSIFANKICKLLYDKYSSDIDDLIENEFLFLDDVDFYIEDITQLIETQIPLLSYYRLIHYFGASCYAQGESEYKSRIQIAKEECKFYYEDSGWFI